MGPKSDLDAIIISDSGLDTLSGTNPLKLHLDGRVGDIQVIHNYIQHNGHVTLPVKGDNELSWSSAPKLNGIYLTSFLTAQGFNVEMIQNYTNEKERFTHLLSQNPRSVILSTSFIFFKKTLRDLVRDIRSIAPDIFIIAGGAFIHYSYLLYKRSADNNYETGLARDDFLFLHVDDEPEIDLYIASPRGEQIVCDALAKLEQGISLDQLANTVRLSGDSYFFGKRTDDVSKVSNPHIDWNILPSSIYKAEVIPLQASNGCPFECSFCNFTKDRRLSFVKPLDQLVEEIKLVEQKGVRYIWFVDDNFRLGRGDLDSVCQRFIDENIQVKWMCFIRASTLEDSNLKLLEQAGCVEVQIGLESGDPLILKNMNKKADPEMYAEVIQKVLHQGINVSCYFICGFPGETEKTAQTTRDFIRSIENPAADGSLSWSIYPFLLSPLSPVYEPEMRKKYGLKGYFKNWKHETMDYNGAKQLTLKAFFELENSGQIYRGDNLDILGKLTCQDRNDFYRIRHLLAKKSIQGTLAKEDIIQSFSKIPLFST